ncbi:MAG TPA: hypothetical protein VF516_04770, partial [Kofleriaceae bacterium]
MVGDLRAGLAALETVVSAVYIGAAGDTRHKLPEAAQATLRDALTQALEDLERRDYRLTRAALLGGARTAMAGGAADLDTRVDFRLPLDVRDAIAGTTRNIRAHLA